VIRASRAAYLVCGVLTALALAGWGVRAAGTPNSKTSNNSAVPLNAPAPAQAPAANNANNANNGANNGQATDQNGQNNDQQQQQPAGPVTKTDVTTKLIAKQIPKMGAVVTDQDGFVLYRFDADTPNPTASNCDANCTKVWPVLTTADGNLPQLEGVDPALVKMLKRPDGVSQVVLGNWPLYRYIGDKVAGKWTGQGVGGKWWVSDQKGKKNLTCVPTSTPKAVAPPPDDNNGGNGGGDTGGNNNGGSNNGGGTY
jgi:predicted lipoprotein with Yx(FWY)xxD motif